MFTDYFCTWESVLEEWLQGVSHEEQGEVDSFIDIFSLYVIENERESVLELDILQRLQTIPMYI